MEQHTENKMGVQPILPLLIKMSLPAMFSMTILALYNVVDSVFISRFDKDALTAISLAFPMQMLIVSVAVGTGVGLNSLISRRLGAKRRDEACSAATHGVFLALASGLVFAAIGLLFAKPFITSFTQTPSVISYGSDYLSIVMIFSVGMFLQTNLEKSLQATGNMIYPMLFQLSGAITNIILDPIFIFGYFGIPAMGAKGAAIATVAGQFVAMIFSFIVYHVKAHEIELRFRGFKLDMKVVKDIYKVGLPSMVMQAIGSLLTTALNMILVTFSETAVSVLGVYYKLQSFIFMPVFGLNQSLMAVMGFNYGARKKERMISAYKVGCFMGIFIMAIGTVLFEVFPAQLLAIFDADQEMLATGIVAFRLIAICFIPAAIGIINSTVFQAVGMGMKSLVISLLRQIVFILPMAWLFAKIGLNYVWLSFPFAEIASLIISVFMIISVYKSVIAPIGSKPENN